MQLLTDTVPRQSFICKHNQLILLGLVLDKLQPFLHVRHKHSVSHHFNTHHQIRKML